MNEITTEQLMSAADALFAYALSRVSDHHEAEDLVQETLVTAWEKRGSFDGRSQLRTWLIGILKFKVLDHFRARKRTPTVQGNGAGVDGEWGDDPMDKLFDRRGAWRADPNYGMEFLVESPADEAMRQDVFEWVRRCMGRLPERLRLLFSMREIDEVPVAEAAVAAGVTPGSAAVLLTRARHQIRDCLQSHQISP